VALVNCTGSKAQLRKLAAVTGSLTALRSKGPFPSEKALYEKFSLSFIEPELREGHQEIKQAAEGTLPVLVTVKDIRGELHAHSTSSDGSNSIEQMAVAARAHGYEYSV
jgi:DNA polymerase (family 10)